MTRKKAALAAIMLAIIAVIGIIAFFIIQYFSAEAQRARALGGLEIDYLVSEEKEDAEDGGQGQSKNIWQWLIDKLAADKRKTEQLVEAEGEGSGSALSLTAMKQSGQKGQNALDGQGEDGTAASPTPTLKPGQTPPPTEEPGKTAAPTPTPTPVAKPTPTPTPADNYVTMTIRCDTAVAKGMNLESKWAGIVPSSGVILPKVTLAFQQGDTVFDVLCRARDKYKFHMSYRGTNGAQYIEGINNLYEFDGGRWSGWMYCVNGWYPNYGSGQYAVKNGDEIEWNYTCDLGRDLGQYWLADDDWIDANE